jgi:hypothetical protein
LISSWKTVWRHPHGYYAIDLKDQDEESGKFYSVDGQGRVVGQGRIAGDRYYPALRE